MIVVADASVLIKLYIAEVYSDEAELLLSPHIELHAPELAVPEVGSILWKKHRQGLIDAGELDTIIQAFSAAPIVFHPQMDLLQGAADGAVGTGQTVYDWTYFALAISLGCPFITADRRLLEAMRSAGYAKDLVWIGEISTV